MTGMPTRLQLSTPDGVALSVAPAVLVVAGYTGRDPDTVRHHIEELAAIGVPEPATIPAFFPLDTGLLTTGAEIEVAGSTTSGEVEPVLLRIGGRCFLTVGSDHTDREIERSAILQSKAACPKPISATVIELGDEPDLADWDSIVARSWVDGDPYQEGNLGAILPISEVVAGWDRTGTGPDVDLAIFGGTLPLLDGTFRFGRNWRMQLEIPGRPPLEASYSVTVGSPDAH